MCCTCNHDGVYDRFIPMSCYASMQSYMTFSVTFIYYCWLYNYCMAHRVWGHERLLGPHMWLVIIECMLILLLLDGEIWRGCYIILLTMYLAYFVWGQ